MFVFSAIYETQHILILQILTKLMCEYINIRKEKGKKVVYEGFCFLSVGMYSPSYNNPSGRDKSVISVMRNPK